MSTQFHRSTRLLHTDGSAGPALVLACAVAILGGWLTWALLARVTHYEVTDGARLEINSSSYPVQAAVSGRVAATKLVMGKEVQAGDVIAEFDSESERLNLEQERARLASFAPQSAVLRAQLASVAAGRDKERGVLNFTVEEARQRSAEADSAATLAEKNAERSAQLLKEKLVSLADDERARADARSKRAAAENLRVAASRLEPELQVRESDRDGKRQEILASLARLEADEASSMSAIKRLEYEVERRKLRAPISGRLGECASLTPGGYVTEGQRLGVILPGGNLRMVANFPPAVALGKIQPGQHAVIRLQGFPWAQFGVVSATVANVAGEVRDGNVRVELALNANPNARIAFQHGMPGSVEIETERISPAAMVLRAAGGLVAGN